MNTTRTRTSRPIRTRLLAGATAALLSVSSLLLVATPARADGGGGGAGGVGGGTAGSFSLWYDMFDRIDATTRTPIQGTMQSSVQWFFNDVGAPLAGYSPNSWEAMQTACNGALANAESRNPAGQNAQSRVVGMYWAGGSSTVWGLGNVGGFNFRNMYNSWVAAGQPNVLSGLPDQAAYNAWIKQGFDEGLAQGVANSPTGLVSAVCVALNSSEITPSYNLSVSTDQAGGFSMAGSTAAVSDTIHTSSNGGAAENVTATVTLNWDGVTGNSTQVSKNVAITNNGDTASPEFVPADFGWSAWPSGRFWYRVSVPKQGSMAADTVSADRDPREMWTATPAPPSKTLTQGTPAVPLGSDQVLASGMSYDARITANSNGYTSMTIKETLDTDKAFVGSSTADVATAPYLLDPQGNKVAGATFVIDRSVNGKIIVTGTVTGIPNVNRGSDYTLVVPTYVLPTLVDYTLVDHSEARYPDGSVLVGNDVTTYKVTPTPDKVWVLDESGAMTVADPAQTNQAGADQMVFLPGDAVSAVVNGSVKAKLATNLTSYRIVDDWSKSSAYVDFSDAAKTHVYYETAPSSGVWADVTDEFTITVTGGVTTATAKDSFLSTTAGQSGARGVKLTLSGAFRTDFATGGALVELRNNGSEVWNNETVATNEPSVFTWTPNPNKQVLGSADQSGSLADADINGLAVYPGQKLEYSVGVDLRVPSRLAYVTGIKTLAVQDVYDANFVPDKSSVELWDSRTASNPRPIARSAYTLTWDESNHSFTVTFTDEWVAAQFGIAMADGDVQWMSQGWLTMRVTGTVKDTTPGGSTVSNRAFQIINGVATATEIPAVTVPKVTPAKEDLSTDLQSIDGLTVVSGDHIMYRLTLDGGPARSALAYNVHKLGMVDDFDEAYLDLTTAGVKVTNKTSGADVTAKFNISVTNGVLYVFAKQVDSVDPYGVAIKGNPQPADLKAYDAASIDPAESPIIDQSLLGSQYWITMDTTVTQAADGYVVKNQASENIENAHLATGIVSNPLKAIDPSKDVVVSEQTGTNSINQSEVALNATFTYRLNSSTVPANRAYAAKSWRLLDTFDKVHDQFTGVWAIYANEDLYKGSTLVVKKGGLLNDSAGHESEALKGLFVVTFDEASYTWIATATAAYLALVNSRGDVPDGFSAYTQMIRIAPSAQVDNTVTENYNSVSRASNTVWTSTPEHPSISVVEYTLEQGVDKGDHDTAADADAISAAALASMSEVGANDDPSKGVKVGFKITNTGDVALKNVTLTDAVAAGTSGHLDQVVCQVQLGTAQRNLLGGDAADAPKTQMVSAASLKAELAVGESMDCEGTLHGLAAGQLHGNEVTAAGESIFTAAKVAAADPWYATAPASGSIAGNPIVLGANLMMVSAGVLGLLVALALGAGLLYTRGRTPRATGGLSVLDQSLDENLG